MEFKQWLNETPIGNFELAGDWRPNAKLRGYKKDDIGILTSQKAVEKIKRQWFKTEEQFDFYFVRSPQAYKYIEIGEVSADFLKEKLKLDIPINPNAITVLFTNNRGAERIPMTGWTIAHRFGHAIRRTKDWQHFNNEFFIELRNLLANVYNYETKLSNYNGGYNINPQPTIKKAYEVLATALGTMKSARQNNIRNIDEFQYELLAQRLLTKEGIRFNPLPKRLITRKAWGNPVDSLWAHISQEELEDWNANLDGVGQAFTYYIDNCLIGLVGRVFVM